MTLLLFLIVQFDPQHCTLQTTISETTLTMTWHRCIPDSDVMMTAATIPIQWVTAHEDTESLTIPYTPDRFDVFIAEQQNNLVGRYVFSFHMDKLYLPLLT